MGGVMVRWGMLVAALAACGAERDPGGGGPPPRLSQTGLGGAGVVAFAPRYELWSDAAAKRRWIYLPPGTAIDKSDPDHWQFPVGTKLWKEFARDGKKLETRLIERTGPGPEDYVMVAYAWRADGSDADLAEDGALDVLGTDHDVPATNRCWQCHGGEPGRVLGHSAIQLERGAPGPEGVAASLGYLHANCGHCHNETGVAWVNTNMILRLAVGETSAAATAIVRTTENVPLSFYREPQVTLRVSPGAPEASALYTRLVVRGDGRQMPPIATEHVDDLGVARVRGLILAWPP
jgi:hypothetical protein